MAGASGILFSMLKSRIEQVEQDLQELNEFLHSKANYIEFFSEIVSLNNPSKSYWTNKEIYRGIRDKEKFFRSFPPQLYSTLRMIGEQSLGNLLISKGLEIELLKEDTIIENGIYIVRYSFTPLEKASNT